MVLNCSKSWLGQTLPKDKQLRLWYYDQAFLPESASGYFIRLVVDLSGQAFLMFAVVKTETTMNAAEGSWRTTMIRGCGGCGRSCKDWAAQGIAGFQLTNVAYLTGFTGSSGYLLVTPSARS
jgi:hypothetical protein